jgi:hypothetical protein
VADANLKVSKEMFMVFRAASFLLPVALLCRFACAQPAPPPEVDRALRARVNQFFQYHVNGEFEKAYDMVAADTRKYYFGAQKIQFKSFKIDSVSYSDNFTKALVTLTAERMMRMQLGFPETLVNVPMSTNWQVEEGKWVWHREAILDSWLTPMGPSDPDALKYKSTAGTQQQPTLTPELIQQRGNTILQATNGLNKAELKLTIGKASSDELIFHNGQPGQVKVVLVPPDLPAGMTAKLDKTDVMGGEDAVLKVHYEPTSAGAPPPSTVQLRLVMEPFDRMFTIPVKLEP